MPGPTPMQYPFPYKTEDANSQSSTGGGGSGSTVPQGGTGQTNLPAYQPLVGNGVSPVISLPTSTTGYVLTSNGPTSLPSFQPSSGGGGGGTVTQVTASSTKGDVGVNVATGTTTPAITISYSGTPNTIAQGGTGSATATTAFTALAPTATKGTTLIGQTGGGYTTIPVGSDGQVLTAASGQTNGVQWTSTGAGSVTSVGLTVPSVLSVSGSPITGSGTLAVGYSGTALPILNGGTGNTTASTAFGALAPTGTKGGLIVGTGSNTFANLPVGTDNFVLSAASGQTDGVQWVSASSAFNSVVAFQNQTTSSQSISTATSTKVTWGTPGIDSNSGWSVANNYYVIPNAGYYFVAASIVYAAGYSAYDAKVEIQKNASVIQTGNIYHAAISAVGNPQVTVVVSCAQGDTIQVNANQDSGASISLAGASYSGQTNFMIASVGGVATAGGAGTVTNVNTSSSATGFTLTGGPITSTGTVALTYSGSAIPITNGGTAATTSQGAINNISQLTTKGDLLVYSGSNATRLPAGSNNFVLTSESAQTNGLQWQSIGSLLSITPTIFQSNSNSTQSITTSTSTQVTGWTPVIDTQTGWNNGAQYYVIPSTGYYTVRGTVQFATTYAAYFAHLDIVKNNSNFIQEGTTYHCAVSARANLDVSGVFSFNASDTIQLNVFQDSGISLTLIGNTVLTDFEVIAVVNYPGGTAPNGTVTSVGLTVPSFLTITGGSPVTTAGTIGVGYSGTALPIANGGTAATTSQSAINNISQMTTTGDMITYNSGNVSRLAAGTNGQVMVVSSGSPGWSNTLPNNYYFSSTNGITINGPFFAGTLNAGSSGQVLTSQGAGSVPIWGSVGSILANNNSWTGTNTYANTSTFNGNVNLNNVTNIRNQLIDSNGSPGTAGQFLVSQG